MYVKYDEWKKNFTQHFSDKVLNMLFLLSMETKRNSFQHLSESDAEKSFLFVFISKLYSTALNEQFFMFTNTL